MLAAGDLGLLKKPQQVSDLFNAIWILNLNLIFLIPCQLDSSPQFAFLLMILQIPIYETFALEVRFSKWDDFL